MNDRTTEFDQLVEQIGELTSELMDKILTNTMLYSEKGLQELKMHSGHLYPLDVAIESQMGGRLEASPDNCPMCGASGFQIHCSNCGYHSKK